MKCPLCGAWATKLETRSRATDNTVRRRYECGNLHRFSSVERVVASVSTTRSPQKGIDMIESSDACRMLPPKLANEKGGKFGFVCIWRMPRDGSDEARRCTVAEFLSQPENKGGSWYIDGGWGGPPGPIRVDWDEAANAWRSRGFPPHTQT